MESRFVQVKGYLNNITCELPNCRRKHGGYLVLEDDVERRYCNKCFKLVYGGWDLEVLEEGVMVEYAFFSSL